ncbi:thioredoxin domain-containing protein [Radiobacillus deserti]|uniref:Thioredoxin n=1 Tax=Radiobacillus deserti TaxID=2594883 RepID=A0A516KCZ6_9BACI|nr:thioredoxin domain-containing protein [Radiobacillus deserti]QDP39216.1 thioredoxin [Radiobacillus deserti]
MKILKFEKDNCPSCNMVEVFLSQHDHIQVEKVNPFEAPKMATSYQIASVPVTILLDDNGQEVKRSIGYKPEELEAIVSEFAQV